MTIQNKEGKSWVDRWRKKREEKRESKKLSKRRHFLIEIAEIMEQKNITEEILNSVIREIFPGKDLRSLSIKEGNFIKKILISEEQKSKLKRLLDMKILKIPIMCIKLFVFIAPWILGFGIVYFIIYGGLLGLLSKFGVPNWKFYLDEKLWYLRELIASIGGLIGTVLIFMGYKHFKLLRSADRDKIIYDLDNMFNVLEKLKKFKKEINIDPLEMISLDNMIVNLEKILKERNEMEQGYKEPFVEKISEICNLNNYENENITELIKKPYVRKIISIGLMNEIVTADELEKILPVDLSSAEIDDIISLLEELGIEIGI